MILDARAGGGGGGWHKASVFSCLPLAAPIGLPPLLILTLCGSEGVLVVSTEPPDDLSCLTGGGGVRILSDFTFGANLLVAVCLVPAYSSAGAPKL